MAVCRNNRNGTRKEVVADGVFREDYGLVGDAYADCCTHRQMSLLATESIDKMRQMGLDVGLGDFAENLATEGIDLISLPIGTRISVGADTALRITQIGKECHTKCAVYHRVGMCVMPEEGVFARVIYGGVARVGDSVKVAG